MYRSCNIHYEQSLNLLINLFYCCTWFSSCFSGSDAHAQCANVAVLVSTILTLLLILLSLNAISLGDHAILRGSLRCPQQDGELFRILHTHKGVEQLRVSCLHDRGQSPHGYRFLRLWFFRNSLSHFPPFWMRAGLMTSGTTSILVQI